jgi:carbamoyl-phosphate synthase large subunit
MPKRHDIQSILIIGAGPIVIGQACEFDYAGVQACKALKEEGYRVILVNSNPATIMTDPAMADAIYIEPLQWECIEKIIQIEKPDALLPTMGGQTALNCTRDLFKHGVLAQYGVELIGASIAAIDKAEDRDLFRQSMQQIGLMMPQARIAHNLQEALEIQHQLGYPTVIRPSFTLGGTGGGIAYHEEEFIDICERGLALSPTRQLLIEESILGWKEYELEVVRDKKDNCIIVCTIENMDPVGVHTGDSITVAPAQTLTDKEYQGLRNAACQILREIGVETGGSNVQFAIHPSDGRMMVIEMNPRVSRSSALASKATGFPIAKIAAKLAVGYTLDELKNDMTAGLIPASFEPSIDYVVTKLPRFNFEKFQPAEDILTTQMKSVGEVMAIGRTFSESLQKALCSLETGAVGFNEVLNDVPDAEKLTVLRQQLKTPHSQRIFYIGEAFRYGLSVNEVAELTAIDPWFLYEIETIIQHEQRVKTKILTSITPAALFELKQAGFSDARLAQLLKTDEMTVMDYRRTLGIYPVYKRVDSCAAEFPTETAYLYSTYESSCEAKPSLRKKIMVLGSGPNRIGQGIEFDYCCVHASMAFAELNFETIMVNCNPETVSTDYDISNRLYFEPLTYSHVLSIIALEEPVGVVVQYGGQTPLKLADKLAKQGVPILGTQVDAIHETEDRELFHAFINKLGLKQAKSAIARTVDEGVAAAKKLGYPLIVRPSFVLGGRAMEIFYEPEDLANYLFHALYASDHTTILLDTFLENAIEVDVDAICDGEEVRIVGMMEHIEQAGIHSGDSACTLPPYQLSAAQQAELAHQVKKIALALPVIGLVNVQFALQGDDIYVLEVNPRASRTVPFVSKALGIPIAKIAAKVMAGEKLRTLLPDEIPTPAQMSVKMPVFSLMKFQGADPILGPEMKSTGEVMGTGPDFGRAYQKALLAANIRLPRSGCVFISVRNEDKKAAVVLAKGFIELGFRLVATRGTAQVIQAAGLHCEVIQKVREGRPHTVDKIKNGEIDLIINTTQGRQAVADSCLMRRTALQHHVCYTTTIRGGFAMLEAMNIPIAFEF